MKSSKLRIAIPLIILGIAAIAYIVHFDFGTLSAFGWSTISLICPLGSLSTLLASKSFILRIVVILAIAIVLMIIFGRGFCGWACPVPVVSKLRNLFRSKKKREKDELEEAEKHKAHAPGEYALDTKSMQGCSGSGCTTCKHKRGNTVDARHIVLLGSLLSATIFGFPVFCLVCPIGLSFATVFLVINLFTMGDMTWTVILAPVILLIEVVFFRKWCSTFCPLSAALSLCGKIGRFFRPSVKREKCVETAEGTSCGICSQVCPEQINPRHPELSLTDISECTRCRRCVESCPAGAIKISVWASKPPEPETQQQDPVRVENAEK